MKIFAFNLSLELRLNDPSEHFSFEAFSLTQIAGKLRTEGLDFPQQIFYSPAGEDELDLVVDLLKDKKMAQLRAVIVLLFDTKKALKKYKKVVFSAFKPIEAAGGLVVNENQELQMILRHGLWDLAKGKVEKGEKNDVAAWREVQEETGLEDHKLDGKLGETYHVFEGRKGWKLKTTHWYWMKSGVQKNLQPQLEEGITEVKWWPIAELTEEIPETFPLVMDLVRACILRK